MTRTPTLARTVIAASSWVLGRAIAADSPDDFESPPDQAPAALLPASMVAGTNYHVVDPVRSDGLMHTYVLDSKFGQFEAYGRSALLIRTREIAALNELARTSSVEIVAGGVGRGVESEVETAVAVVAHPVQTVTGIPKGVTHLFHGYVDEGKEAAADLHDSAVSARASGASASTAAAKGASAAKHYANRYLGVTAAERHWYEKLGIDPYTDNALLRTAIYKTAKVDAAAGFGTRFVGIPSIPGIGDLHQVMDAVYKEDPATIRARSRATLAGYGLESGEIDRWQNTPVLSPTRQLLLLKAAAVLNGVDGRGELFRRAMGLTTDAEAQVYLQSVGLLVLAHRKQAIVAIVPGVWLPAGRRADGHIIVCGAFESVYWTAEVASGEQQIRQALPQGAGARELWLAGTVSAWARAELQARGWQLEAPVP